MKKEQKETLKQAKAEEKPLTIEQRIKALQNQYAEAKEVALRCEGAISILNELLNEQK